MGQVLASAAPETAARGMLRHKIADPSQLRVTQISGDYRGLRYKSGSAVLNPVTTMKSQSEGREICMEATVVKNDSISLGGQNLKLDKFDYKRPVCIGDKQILGQTLDHRDLKRHDDGQLDTIGMKSAGSQSLQNADGRIGFKSDLKADEDLQKKLSSA